MSDAKTCLIPLEPLRSLEEEIFLRQGFSKEGAAIVADSLLEADMTGMNSHGAIRIPVYSARLQHKVAFPDGPLDIAEDHGAVAVIDGHDTFGQVSGVRAMELAIQKAEQYGIGLVGVRNSHHYGICAYYTRMAAAKKMIGVSASNTTPLMPPSGGAGKMVGNNPISYAIPARRYPDIVLDIALSAVAHGRIQVAAKKGESIPAGWATDSAGRPTTDAQAALTGFLSPVGAHKGFGLAVIVDLLCGPLLGGGCGGEITGLNGCFERPQNCGHIFSAIDISKFTSLDTFLDRVDGYVEYIKSCPKVDEDSRIYMPGEIEHLKHEKSLREGVSLPTAVVEDLKKLCAELGIDPAGRL